MSQEFQAIRIEGVAFGISQEYGALLVYTNPENQGREIYADFDRNSSNRVWANVIERIVNGRPTFIAVFPRLKEGLYEVGGVLSKYSKKVNVFPGNVAEADFRGSSI